ncbi:DUF3152 domain-containing protein [Mobilicoccus sp.]|uniref:DUF3152 domain-containing protein n=1 Tax=Mobilicoccus sp. TaxID=2034349 RepID=UPI0028B015D5|nr:DUF3152 domain-containing protein [Mobilicoccus sp.]
MSTTGAGRRGRSTTMAVAVALLLAACGATPGPGGADAPGAPAPTTLSVPMSPAPATVEATTPSAGATTSAGPAGEAEGDIPESPADPDTVDVPEAASGTTRVVSVPGADTPASEAPGRVVRYTVEVEKGLEDVAAGFPAAVRADLTDRRGWQTKDGIRFVNVSPEQRDKGAKADIRILFASPRLVDAACAPLRTNGRLSCHHDGKVMVNAWRWIHGSPTYGDDLANYRVYLVNHEVGHSIGHGHRPCPSPGAKAPVMLQQTLHLEGCRANPYPTVGPR